MIERLILTTKQVLRRLPLILLRRESLRRELVAISDWYNEHRPPHGFEREDSERSLRKAFPRPSQTENRTTSRLATCIAVREAPYAGWRPGR